MTPAAPDTLREPIQRRLNIDRPAPSLGVEPPEWTLDALCQGFPIEMFYPEGKGSPTRDAQSVCDRCPVSVACLDDALRLERGHSYSYGVRGGLSAHQRRRILRGKETAA